MEYWYKNAIIYALDVETYLDSNGDGAGDFTGLTRTLDYLANLGVTCLWLMPFYPSPNRDNGYDIADYYGVDQRLGNLGDFVKFIDEAGARNLRVLVDLVVNHTSEQHPWFKEARKDRNSLYHDYYIWLDEEPAHDDEEPIFGKSQGGHWSYAESVKQYYYHTFYDFQPDLNLTNPRVLGEIHKIMRFWLQLGVSGFRMDAVPHMLKQKGEARFDGDPHDILRDFHDYVTSQHPEAALLAEVDVEPKDYQAFFGDEDKLPMLFNFYLDNYLFLAFARREAAPIAHALKALPRACGEEQYVNFLRNYDELDLERLSDKEREEVFAAFAPEKKMRFAGRGIRRRLAPMLDGDRCRLELAYSLLFSLPGTPLLLYGEEIGMGDDLSLDERNPVRTPMQWSHLKNAGFSSAPTRELIHPIISGGAYDYEKVNVNTQRRDASSLFNWMGRAIRARKECAEFGWGKLDLLETGHPGVLAHRCVWESSTALALHNLTDQGCTVKLELENAEELLELFSDRTYPPLDDGPLELAPYGYRWFRTATLRP